VIRGMSEAVLRYGGVDIGSTRLLRRRRFETRRSNCGHEHGDTRYGYFLVARRRLF